MKYLLSLFVLMIISCNSQKSNSNYSKIEYEAGACFGFCPIFKIKINPDRIAIIEAEHFTFSEGRSKDEFSKPREGTFKTTIKEADFNKLMGLIDNLDVNNLNNDYGNQNVTDLPTSYLNVAFTNGNTKRIKDYGKNGTPELKEVYNFIESLPKSQTWTKVK